MEKANQTVREGVFLRPQFRSYGGRRYRAVSAGSAALCRMHGVTFIDGLESLKTAGEAAAQEQIFLFLFIHGYPEVAATGITPEGTEQLLEALDLPREEFMRRHLIPFAMDIPMAGLMAFIVEWLAEENKAALESVFEVVKRLAPGASPVAEDDHPNG
jgi:hypothetical protein